MPPAAGICERKYHEEIIRSSSRVLAGVASTMGRGRGNLGTAAGTWDGSKSGGWATRICTTTT